MTKPNEAMKAMARRIADETIPEDSHAYDTHDERMADWYVARDAALAAIMETQRLDAELAEARFAEGGWDAGHSNAGIIIGGYIRTGEHYAAIGEDIGGGRG